MIVDGKMWQPTTHEQAQKWLIKQLDKHRCSFLWRGDELEIEVVAIV
ncbi:hypothetical protein BS78_10G088800 [Paspalum vaginatum]|nr:hypothetical protein BS78_10G088800 [Paspalum vaginatum]